ncbi:MAG: flagellar protein FlbB [Treponema sp.]|nr:flagellar protein FlbB [Treponema sp.]
MGKALGKTIVLLILIVILIIGGLLWFDFLGVINMKGTFSPVYRLLGLAPQTSSAVTNVQQLNPNLDQDRIDKQRQALALQQQELDQRESAIVTAEQQNELLAQELADRERAQAEREKMFSNTVQRYDAKEVNVEQIAANLNGMPPANAVGILVAMDDQIVIDVLRKCDEIAARDGSYSLVAYWLSLMPAERAAEIQRKMINKPNSL